MTDKHRNRRWKLRHAMSNFRHNYRNWRRAANGKIAVVIGCTMLKMSLATEINVRLLVGRKEA